MTDETTVTQVRAKFKCSRVTVHEGGYREITLNAVFGTAGENKDFADATPSGTVTIGISPGRPAGPFFAPGKEYYLDFTEAPKPQP